MGITSKTLRDLAEQEVPFPVRNLSVMPDGSISAQAASNLSFHYLLNRRRWDCTVAVQADGNALLTVSRIIGQMPFSADGPAQRAAMREIISAVEGVPHCKAKMDSRGYLTLMTHRLVPGPIDDTLVLTAAVSASMTLQPWTEFAEKFAVHPRIAA
jgi:hypothetical protein